jgi:Tfp pilus assembly protein PilF
MTSKTNLEDVLTRALDALAKEEYPESIGLFSDVLTEQPENKISLISRGSAFLRLNLLDEALTDFDRTIASHPSYARTYHLRGLVKARQGVNQAALADFDKAVALDPHYGAAFTSRAIVHQELGHDALATDDMATVAGLTRVNLETYAAQNKVWQTRHLQVEETLESELNR